MSAFKFRYGTGEAFENAINGLKDNYYWAPTIESLNDPFETMVGTESFLKKVSWFGRLFNASERDVEGLGDALLGFTNRRHRVGIFALSKTVLNELLWAHYGDSHSGFCIEYDMDVLLRKRGHHGRYQIDVSYAKGPASVSIRDPFINDDQKIFQKVFGVKSIAWKYEEEVRIVSDNSGKVYYGFEGVKSIYFGLRMPEESKKRLMEVLKGRGIRYYQMHQSKSSYTLSYEEISDEFSESTPYPYMDNNSGQKLLEYEIHHIELKRIPDVGKANIVLKERVSSHLLELLSKNIYQKNFLDAKRVFLGFHLPHMNFNSLFWANAQIDDGIVKLTLNGNSQEELDAIFRRHDMDDREIVCKWEGEPQFYTLFRDEKNFSLETTVSGQHWEEKYSSEKLSEGMMFKPDKESVHREYFIINSENGMEWYGENGKFMELAPFQ